MRLKDDLSLLLLLYVHKVAVLSVCMYLRTDGFTAVPGYVHTHTTNQRDYVGNNPKGCREWAGGFGGGGGRHWGRWIEFALTGSSSGSSSKPSFDWTGMLADDHFEMLCRRDADKSSPGSQVSEMDPGISCTYTGTNYYTIGQRLSRDLGNFQDHDEDLHGAVVEHTRSWPPQTAFWYDRNQDTGQSDREGGKKRRRRRKK